MTTTITEGTYEESIPGRIARMERSIRVLQRQVAVRPQLNTTEGDFRVAGGGSVEVEDGGGVHVTEGGDITVQGGQFAVLDADEDVVARLSAMGLLVPGHSTFNGPVKINGQLDVAHQVLMHGQIGFVWKRDDDSDGAYLGTDDDGRVYFSMTDPSGTERAFFGALYVGDEFAGYGYLGLDEQSDVRQALTSNESQFFTDQLWLQEGKTGQVVLLAERGSDDYFILYDAAQQTRAWLNGADGSLALYDDQARRRVLATPDDNSLWLYDAGGLLRVQLGRIDTNLHGLRIWPNEDTGYPAFNVTEEEFAWNYQGKVSLEVNTAGGDTQVFGGMTDTEDGLWLRMNMRGGSVRDFRFQLYDGTYTKVHASDFQTHSARDSKTLLGWAEKGALDRVRSTPIRRWRYKASICDPCTGEKIADHPEQIGPVADEAPPETRADDGEGGAVSIPASLWTLWQAVQEQAELIDRLQDRIAALEAAR